MMLIRSFPFLDPGSITPELTDRLRSLAEDGAALGSDPSFVLALLPRTPLLDRYAPVITSLGLRLAGEVTDHPLLGSRKIITSQLWWVDPNARWARTLSRFYRLGRPIHRIGISCSRPCRCSTSAMTTVGRVAAIDRG
ncbi:DUF6634 family protein [Rhodopseudomonas parapalustris]